MLEDIILKLYNNINRGLFILSKINQNSNLKQ